MTDTQEIKRDISALKEKVTEQEADLKEVTQAVWQLTKSIGQLSENVKAIGEYMQAAREKGIANDKDFQSVARHVNEIHDEVDQMKSCLDSIRTKGTYFGGIIAAILVVSGLVWNYVSPHIASIVTMEKRISILEIQQQKLAIEFDELRKSLNLGKSKMLFPTNCNANDCDPKPKPEEPAPEPEPGRPMPLPGDPITTHHDDVDI